MTSEKELRRNVLVSKLNWLNDFLRAYREIRQFLKECDPSRKVRVIEENWDSLGRYGKPETDELFVGWYVLMYVLQEELTEGIRTAEQSILPTDLNKHLLHVKYELLEQDKIKFLKAMNALLEAPGRRPLPEDLKLSRKAKEAFLRLFEMDRGTPVTAYLFALQGIPYSRAPDISKNAANLALKLASGERV